MTRYGSDPITYDTIGNPRAFGDYTLSWKGRQLVSAYDNEYITTTYGYNADGIRTYKQIYDDDTGNTRRYEYALNGSQIVKETVYLNNVEQYTLVYIYDETGAPIGMKYRTPSYSQNVYDCFFFEKNLQGDIISVYREDGAKVITYTYDAWGNFTTTYPFGSSAASIASRNPFKYRGYYYDADPGLYYLQSRYYNPEWCRFINGDAYINANGTIFGYNLFAYCDNNPIRYIDPLGTSTLSYGINVGGHLISGISYSVFLSLDNKGNIALQYSEANILKKQSGASFGIFGGSAGFFGFVTSENTVNDLNGTGFSVSVGDVQIGVSEEGITSFGYSTGKSGGIPISAEASETKTVFQFNVFEGIQQCWQKIKLWFAGE